MKGAPYAAFDDPYCYKGTFVLKNKAGLRDGARLEEFELVMSSLRAEEALPIGRYGPAHYRAVHRHLFQDVYAWAGRYRKVRTAKGASVFCFPEHIDQEMRRAFVVLRDAAFLPGAGRAGFAASAASFLADLNAIHPFREGNGRTQLAFLHLLAMRAAAPLDMTKLRPAPFLRAMVASFSGDTAPLERELLRLLR